MFELPLQIKSEKKTAALACRLAELSKIGDVIYLKGTLGMGKSSFARSFIRHLSGDPHQEVPSPTFTLVQTYDDLDLPVWHFDLYRLESPEEVEEIGIDEALSSAVSLIEWPEHLGRLSFSKTLVICFEPGADSESRRVVLSSSDSSWEERLKGFEL